MTWLDGLELLLLFVAGFRLNKLSRELKALKQIEPENVQAEFKLLRDCIVAYRSDFKALREDTLQQHAILSNRMTGVALDAATRCNSLQAQINAAKGVYK